MSEMMKLSDSQRSTLEQALEGEREHGEVNYYFEACVLDRHRAGLVRAGVIAKIGGSWCITDDARAYLKRSRSADE